MDAFFCHDESYLSRLDVYTYLQYAFQNTSRFGASKRRFVSLFLSCQVWRGGKRRWHPGTENLLPLLIDDEEDHLVNYVTTSLPEIGVWVKVEFISSLSWHRLVIIFPMSNLKFNSCSVYLNSARPRVYFRVAQRLEFGSSSEELNSVRTRVNVYICSHHLSA